MTVVDRPDIPGLTPDQYRAKFDRIVPRLNWDAFMRRDWPVRVIETTSIEDVFALQTAFRIRFGKLRPRFLKTVFSRYMSVGETLAHLEDMGPLRQSIIGKRVEEFRRSEGPVEIELPVYAMGSRQSLILDGNHRACALAISGMPFRLRLYRVEGPWLYLPR